MLMMIAKLKYQIDSDTGFKIEGIEVSGGQSYQEKKKGWKIGGQEFIHQPPLECDFHL